MKDGGFKKVIECSVLNVIEKKNKMIKKESKANTIFNQYLREKRKEGFYCYYEIKIGKGENFYFKDMEVNQSEGLPALEKSGMVWKFSDDDRRKKPCDGASLPPLPSYLVIRFGTVFYMIRIEVFVKMTQEGKTKITLIQSKELAERVIHT